MRGSTKEFRLRSDMRADGSGDALGRLRALTRPAAPLTAFQSRRVHSFLKVFKCVANAYAGRFVRTIRTECLDSLLIVGRRHLERALRTYVASYNRERPHRGLSLLTPEPATAICRLHIGRIERRDRLGGLIHEYHRVAA
jgi:transposase InsO family protein